MVLSLFHFLLFAFSQIATPGPANMIMLATGAKYGFRKALPFVFGVIIGKQIIIWPIGFGLMLLNKDHPYILSFKYVSAGYILWLAWRMPICVYQQNLLTNRPLVLFLVSLCIP